METTPAILLRKIKLTESSLIVTWFTEAHGKLKTVAKGARRLRRALDYLDQGEPNRRALLHFESQLSRLLGLTGEHNADADPAQAIVRLAGKLPRDRAGILKGLPHETAAVK